MTRQIRFGSIIFSLLLVSFLASGFVQAPERSGQSPFDGERAFRDLETVVGYGPRPAGSDNIERTREYVLAELVAAGLEPILDSFTAQTPLGRIDMVNIRAVRAGSSSATIVVSGHYDTKLFDEPFVGANDGGSSTAVVLELARVSDRLELEHSLEFIFFDGEEAVIDWTATDSLYGSRYDVGRRIEEGSLDSLKALVLVDMIGDRDLGILQESGSTDWLLAIIWDTAGRLGYARNFNAGGFLVEDDHVPYLRAGIPAVDLIDFDYPEWHTTGDTLDKTSAASLKIVGDVLFNALPAIDLHLVSNQR